MNWFELFGIAPAFTIDPAALEKAYFTAQRQFHPDRMIGKSGEEKLAAMQRSADINRAYETLKSPLARAQYLLQLQSITVGTHTDTVKPSHALLTEIMELRETPPGKEELNAMLEHSIQQIAAHCEAKNWPQMAHETLRLGYLQKMKDDLK